MPAKLPSRIVSFDLGMRCGWAVYLDGTILSGYRDNKVRDGSIGMSFLRFRGFLVKLFDQCGGWDAAYYEEVAAHAGTRAAHVYGSMWGILTGFCEEVRVPYEGIPVGTIKKFCTGVGNASKALMVMRVQERWSPTVKEENEADALALLYYALETNSISPETPWIGAAGSIEPGEEICAYHHRIKNDGVCGECPEAGG